MRRYDSIGPDQHAEHTTELAAARELERVFFLGEDGLTIASEGTEEVVAVRADRLTAMRGRHEGYLSVLGFAWHDNSVTCEVPD